MFLGTHHNKLHGQSNYDTLAVEETYNLFVGKRKLKDGEKLDINKDNLKEILESSKKCLLEDKTVLRLKPRLHIIGDICGNYNNIWNLISTAETTDHFLFLGNYVNKGKHSLELITLILCMKLLAPNQVFLLRGAEETANMTEHRGFKDDCLNQFDDEIYKSFLEVFECMPLAAVVANDDKSILFMNGTLSPNFQSVEQLENVERPIKNVDNGIAHDVLCSDSYGKVKKSTVHNFLKNNHIDQIVSSHQNKGFYYPFGDDHCLLSISSKHGMNIYIREDMLYTFSNRTNLNSYEEKINNPVYPMVNVD